MDSFSESGEYVPDVEVCLNLFHTKYCRITWCLLGYAPSLPIESISFHRESSCEYFNMSSS